VCDVSGTARHLQCPYHGWTFGLDGGLRHRPDGQSFSAEGRGLRPIRVEEAGGLVWLSAAESGPDLAAWLGPMLPMLRAQGLERMSLTSHVSVMLDCNWKLSSEVHLESYHVHSLHPDVLPWVDDTAVRVQALGMHGAMWVPMARPSGRLTAPTQMLAERLAQHGIAAEGMSLTEQRQAFGAAELAVLQNKGADTGDLTPERLVETQFLHLFPNVQLNAYGHSIMLFRHHPHPTDPGRCRFEQQIFSLVPGDPTRGALPRTVPYDDPAIGPVTAADLLVAQRLQESANSPAFDPEWSEQELLIRHFYEVLSDYVDRRTVSSQSSDPLPSA